MAYNDFSNRLANFLSELNSRFSDELVLTKRECLGLGELSEVFDIDGDYVRKEVRFTRSSTVAVGAHDEVEKLAKQCQF